MCIGPGSWSQVIPSMRSDSSTSDWKLRRIHPSLMFRICQGWIVTTAHTSRLKMLRALPVTHRPMRLEIRRRRAMTSLPMIWRILTK